MTKMNEMKRVWESVSVDASTVEEDEEYLVFKDVVLVREGIQQYSDGRAYKSAEELEKYAPFANGWAVAGGHPKNPSKLLINVNDIAGETFNSRFVKDLLDPKTKRKNIRGVRADLRVWKNKVDKTLLDELRSGKKNDVSVGFIFKNDKTSGTWNGQDYDYSQKNMFPNHLAYGIEKGRCPSPFCGLAADAVMVADEEGMVTFSMTIHVDHMEGMRAFVDSFPSIGNKENVEGDKMENKEIDTKIAELKAQKEELREKVDAHYKAQEPEEEDTVISKLYEEIEELDAQIEAYIEAKVIKEVIGDTPDGDDSKEGTIEPCECGKIWAEKFPEAFQSLPDELRATIIPEQPAGDVPPVLEPEKVIERAKRVLDDPSL